MKHCIELLNRRLEALEASLALLTGTMESDRARASRDVSKTDGWRKEIGEMRQELTVLMRDES